MANDAGTKGVSRAEQKSLHMMSGFEHGENVITTGAVYDCTSGAFPDGTLKVDYVCRACHNKSGSDATVVGVTDKGETLSWLVKSGVTQQFWVNVVSLTADTTAVDSLLLYYHDKRVESIS
jgi:hypothetical protein